MKKTSAILIGTVITLTALTGCKTSEQNYRQAYEIARNANTEGIDSTIYARIRQEAVPSAVLADGDTIKMQTEFVTPFNDGQAPASTKAYGVVAGQFKQIFNAKAMRNRLHTSGYPDAYIVQTREPLYYVVTADFDNVDQAAAFMKKISTDSSLGLRTPFPWILKNPRR